MTDKIEFRVIDPAANGELWAKDYSFDEKDKRLKAVEIYINGIELADILRKIETPFAQAENHPELAGSYGHNVPGELYRSLTNAVILDTYEYKYGVELLCCASCGDSGCWSCEAMVKQDGEFVYWEKFSQNHRKNWNYNISYKFEKTDYEREMLKLKEWT